MAFADGIAAMMNLRRLFGCQAEAPVGGEAAAMVAAAVFGVNFGHGAIAMVGRLGACHAGAGAGPCGVPRQHGP
jgi:hypothetical protein